MTSEAESGAGERRRSRPTSRARGLTTTSLPRARRPPPRPRDKPVLFVLQGREQGAVFPVHAERMLVGREATADVSLSDDTRCRLDEYFDNFED